MASMNICGGLGLEEYLTNSINYAAECGLSRMECICILEHGAIINFLRKFMRLFWRQYTKWCYFGQTS